VEDSLYNIEPRVLWKHFLEISKIPRGSGNESAASRYVDSGSFRLLFTEFYKYCLFRFFFLFASGELRPTIGG